MENSMGFRWSVAFKSFCKLAVFNKIDEAKMDHLESLFVGHGSFGVDLLNKVDKVVEEIASLVMPDVKIIGEVERLGMTGEYKCTIASPMGVATISAQIEKVQYYNAQSIRFTKFMCGTDYKPHRDEMFLVVCSNDPNIITEAFYCVEENVWYNALTDEPIRCDVLWWASRHFKED